MSRAKTIPIREQALIDSLKRAILQKPAEKIRIALQLSKLASELFAAARKVAGEKK